LTSKAYLRAMVCVVLGLALPFVLFNFYQDDFGLFWSTGPKRIWTLEKTTKYLMSYRYIPQNFDGMLLGPSYSDGFMDTKRLAGYRIYNLSMDAGNATELRAAAVNAIVRGHMQVMIICLSPYLTQDRGMKGPQINPKEYWGSLFSWLPFDVWQAKWQIRSGKVPDAFDGSEWGMGNMIPRPIYTAAEFARVQREHAENVHVDPVGIADLKDIIATAHAHGVQVFAYFHPYSFWRMQTTIELGEFAKYRGQILTLFDRLRDEVWDMTASEYAPFTTDPACYTDGHLSKAGANILLADIQRRLQQRRQGGELPSLFDPSVKLACMGKPGAGSGFDRSG
jgi:hypothetical protein